MKSSHVPPEVCLGELAKSFDLTLRGPPEVRIHGVCALEGGVEGCIAFLAKPAYLPFLQTTRAAAVIISPDRVDQCPLPSLVTRNPYLAFARIVDFFQEKQPIQSGIHPRAWVSHGARVEASAHIGSQSVIETGAYIGENVIIGPGCTIGPGCDIADETYLSARVTLCEGVSLGRRVVVQPGAVVGSRGFGLAEDEGRWIAVPQVGRVVVGDDVEIGSNTTIDRGALEDTVIEDGVKLDNLIQIGHNVRIGQHTVVSGCTGIAGSTRIGSHCMIGGHVGINDHIEITDGVIVAAMSAVSKSLREPGTYSSATPVIEAGRWRRLLARIRRLENLENNIKKLKQIVQDKEDLY